MVGMSKDTKVGGGVGGTCEVTKNQTQHSPSSGTNFFKGRRKHSPMLSLSFKCTITNCIREIICYNISVLSTTETNFTNKLIRDLNDILLLHGKQISDFELPTLLLYDLEDNVTPINIQEQLSLNISHQDLEDVGKLNFDQSFAFNTIMNFIEHRDSKFLCVEVP
ncbi:hypothetical protein Lal_00039688 [Lupinus albus]|nr:hypothetical protein Lal_00039688 [Lupinus albus]